MHYILSTRIGKTISNFASRLSCTEKISIDHRNMEKLGKSQVSSAKEICDYIGLSPIDLLIALCTEKGLIEAYRKGRVSFRIECNDAMLELAKSDVTEKSIPTILRAWEFLSHNTARSTIDADKLKLSQLDAINKNKISKKMLQIGKEKLKIDKESLKLRQEECFIKLVSGQDDETLRKIQNNLRDK